MNSLTQLVAMSATALLLSGIACSSSSNVTSGSPDSGIIDTTPDPNAPSCSVPTDCPLWHCDCEGSAPVNAQHCSNERCENAAVACPSSCANFGSCWEGTATGGWAGGTSTGESTCGPIAVKDGGVSNDSGVPISSRLCIPISPSSAYDASLVALAQIASLKTVPASTANGTVTTTKNAKGDPTRVDYDATGSANDYTDTFLYNSAGLLIRFDQDASGSAFDMTDTMLYDSSGRIIRYDHDAAGSTDDYTDTFLYSSAGLLIRFDHDAAGSTADVTNTYLYNSGGRIIRYDHDAYASVDDITETFTYDSQGRLISWSKDVSGSGDASVSVSYGSNGTSNIQATNAPAATITNCP